ncbi:DUF4837 family protein [uncultured Lacinutrix sp.]|uniref:DUF4837 family protein n=1 Tax=uncultured Lacinutrix sp. TaxID=574032 RepID=UPI002612CFA2|nr:DUF4837 family protein [uncultured Lacinutrix sp.]
MRKLLGLVLIVVTVFSCDKKKGVRILPESAGPINNIAIVIDNELWENTVGETLRNVLTTPVDGLPQEEPLFSLRQIPSQVFTGFAKENRNVLKIEQGEADFKIARDVHARPQKVILVRGKDIAEIKSQIEANTDKIISGFKAEDIREKQRQSRKSLYNASKIEEGLNINIEFPTTYRITNTIAEEKDKFYWIKKDIPTGYTNILLYELPITAINKNDSLVSQIIKVRDSIGKKYIGGPTDGSYMATDKAYAPHLYEIILDNKPTIEVKGIWDVNGAFMSGPFITYFIEDKINKRFIVAEGFAYAPNVSKRNHVFELESIIKSIKLN